MCKKLNFLLNVLSSFIYLFIYLLTSTCQQLDKDKSKLIIMVKYFLLHLEMNGAFEFHG